MAYKYTNITIGLMHVGQYFIEIVKFNLLHVPVYDDILYKECHYNSLHYAFQYNTIVENPRSVSLL